MKFSIVIPAYNVEKYLGRTIETALSQTLLPDEIIVVDDGSTDNTRKIAESFKHIRYFYQKNSGAAVARNRGAKEAVGDWILFLDADDECLPERVEKVSVYLKENPLPVMICGNEFEGNHDVGWKYKNLFAYYNKNQPLFPQLFKRCFLSTSSMAVKREIFLKVGGMDPKLRSAQDFDLWLRMALEGELGFIDSPLSRYTIREGNISSNPVNRYKCLLVIFNKHFRKVPLRDALYRYALIHYEVFNISMANRRYAYSLTLPFQFLMNLVWLFKY